MSSSPPPDPSPVLSYEPATAPRTYTVGTLVYTRAALAQVFVWLLLGDFCLHLMDNGVIPTLVPLQFERLGASKTLYNFIAGTVVNILYVVLVPIVSTWSDRARTPMGRRRPFLLFTAPLLAIVLVLLGFSTNLGRWLQTAFPALLGGYTVPAVALGLTIGLFIAFKLLDLFPQSVYYYLWPDVIPPQFLGTFGAMFRVVYAGGSLVFNLFLIGMAKDHPETIYCLSALLYLAAFTLLVWRVNEPEYPPPPAAQAAADGEPAKAFTARIAAVVAAYFRDCFSHPFYWKYFMAMAAFQCAYQPFMANLVYFGKKIYGDTGPGLTHYGQVMGIRDVLLIAIYACMIPVMARLHPLRAGVLGYVMITLTAAAGTFLIHDEGTFRWITILVFATVGFYLVGTAALPARLLPKDKYGQFNSAGAVIVRLLLAVVFTPAGFIFETFGPRFVFAWLLTFTLIGTALMLLLYREWQRLGGEKGFTPPAGL